MEFRRANITEVDYILGIIEEGQEFFRREGIPQWMNGYPNKDTISEDINKGYSYVLVDDGEIVGTTALIYGVEPTYEKIYEGEWLTDAKDYAILHRVAVRSSKKGKGLARRIVEAVEEDSRIKGIRSIRIDTHRKNISMQNMVKKAGFTYCGIIYLDDGAERIAFEKELE